MKKNKRKQKAVIDPTLAWLHRRNATPEEIAIYNIMVAEYKRTTYSMMNGVIAEATGLYRTTVLYHLKSMIEKGLVKKHGPRRYSPVVLSC